jgi:hypothetical protein
VISDLNGKEIYRLNDTGRSEEGRHLIDLSALPSGLYVVTIKGEDTILNQKLMIK